MNPKCKEKRPNTRRDFRTFSEFLLSYIRGFRVFFGGSRSFSLPGAVSVFHSDSSGCVRAESVRAAAAAAGGEEDTGTITLQT